MSRLFFSLGITLAALVGCGGRSAAVSLDEEAPHERSKGPRFILNGVDMTGLREVRQIMSKQSHPCQFEDDHEGDLKEYYCPSVVTYDFDGEVALDFIAYDDFDSDTEDLDWSEPTLLREVDLAYMSESIYDAVGMDFRVPAVRLNGRWYYIYGESTSTVRPFRDGSQFCHMMNVVEQATLRFCANNVATLEYHMERIGVVLNGVAQGRF
jgi:hypothetical protein